PINDCGLTTTGIPFQYIILNTHQQCYNNYVVFPNPAINTLNINIAQQVNQKATKNNRNKGFSIIEITDKFGNIKFRKEYAKGTKNAILNISSLPVDVYILRIYNGYKWEDHKVMITH